MEHYRVAPEFFHAPYLEERQPVLGYSGTVAGFRCWLAALMQIPALRARDDAEWVQQRRGGAV